MPAGLAAGRIPAARRSPEAAAPFQPGEAAGRARLRALPRATAIEHYADRHDRLAGGTSGSRPTCTSAASRRARREERARATGGAGAEAFARQLAWRDFYAHVLLHHPATRARSYQPRYRDLEWDDDAEPLDAWREGRTGFPLVDAGMRQLRARRAGCTTARG